MVETRRTSKKRTQKFNYVCAMLSQTYIFDWYDPMKTQEICHLYEEIYDEFAGEEFGSFVRRLQPLYVIYKLAELVDYPQLYRLYNLRVQDELGNLVVLELQDEIWKILCEEKDWVYIHSPIELKDLTDNRYFIDPARISSK